MSKSKAIIHIVDDDESIRTALTRLLEIAGYEVRCYENAGDFLLNSVPDEQGCLILDIRMPGPSGMDLQTALLNREHPMPIIFLTGHGDIPMSVQAIKAGAIDFLTKPVARDVLLESVERALIKDQENRLEQAKIKMLSEQFLSLTPRERLVFCQVVDGALNKEIASELDISERTVKAYRAQVMEKFLARSLVDLVRIVDELKRYGILSP